MTIPSYRVAQAGVSATIMATGLLAAGCVVRPSGPVAVAAANPSITYVYHNDDELLQANQSAAGYCAQYQASPRTARLDDGPDGRIAVFECVQGGPVTTTTTMVETGPIGGPTPIDYDGYYDDYYGPFYDGYWAADGFFYFADGPGRSYRRDDFHHFRREASVGFHGVHSTMMHRG